MIQYDVIYTPPKPHGTLEIDRRYLIDQGIDPVVGQIIRMRRNEGDITIWEVSHVTPFTVYAVLWSPLSDAQYRAEPHS